MDLYVFGTQLGLSVNQLALTLVANFYAAFRNIKALSVALNSTHLAPIYSHQVLQMENFVFGM